MADKAARGLLASNILSILWKSSGESPQATRTGTSGNAGSGSAPEARKPKERIRVE